MQAFWWLLSEVPGSSCMLIRLPQTGLAKGLPLTCTEQQRACCSPVLLHRLAVQPIPESVHPSLPLQVSSCL